MKRCRWIAPLLLVACASAPTAHAQPKERAEPIGSSSASSDVVQTGRVFPLRAERGNLRIVASPDVMLNGKTDRLSPGARIRNLQNALVQPSTLGKLTYVVNYLRNAGGELHEVWLLTDAEAKAKLPTMAASGARRGQAVDDGKTPFDQLPKWNPATPR